MAFSRFGTTSPTLLWRIMSSSGSRTIPACGKKNVWHSLRSKFISNSMRSKAIFTTSNTMWTLWKLTSSSLYDWYILNPSFCPSSSLLAGHAVFGRAIIVFWHFIWVSSLSNNRVELFSSLYLNFVWQVLDFTRLMTQHFDKERRQVGLHGLFTKYQRYVQPLAANYCLQSNLLVTLMLKHDYGTPADTCLCFCCSSDLFHVSGRPLLFFYSVQFFELASFTLK